MDEDSNQSSRSSNPHIDLHDEESKHRESDSQMTLTYGGSDSELNDNDTLRLEDSDDEEEQCSAEQEQPKAESGTINETGSSNDPQSITVSQVGMEPSNGQNEGPEKPSTFDDSNDEEDKSPNIRSRKKISQLIDTDSEEEQTRSNVPAKKVSNIIDSDDGSEQSDKDQLKKQNAEIDAIGEKIETSMSRFKSLIDSDSASPANDSDGETKTQKKKKLKTKKERDQGKTNAKKDDPKDLLSSLNLDFSDDESRPAASDGDNSSGSQNSGSGSETDDRRQKKHKSKNSSHDKPQRMSAKAAMEQMQVIQSESQRMAREAAISVPYHRPKQHTLQEFLSRRTILKPVVSKTSAANVSMGRRKAAAAIKMTPEQLAAYAKQLEEREKEALEFFKSESDEDTNEQEKPEKGEQPDVEMKPAEEGTPIDKAMVPASSEGNKHDTNDPVSTEGDVIVNASNGDEPASVAIAPMDTELVESLRVSDTEDDALDALVNKTSENVESLLASQVEPENIQAPADNEPVAGPSNQKPVIDYDPFPEPTPSKLAQIKAELLMEGSFKACPALTGDPDMMIDLDTGDVLPKTPSGPELLLQRFVKCSGKKAHKATSVDILSTDKGVVEMNTVKLDLEQEERDPNGKEPVPGAAYMKLKQSLWEKMEQARRNSLLKKQQETQSVKKIDDDEEDEEEALIADGGLAEDDDEDETECNDNDDDDEEEVSKSKRCDLLDDEAEVDEDDEEDDGALVNQAAECEESNEESSDEDSEQESKDESAIPDKEKRKSRIIAAFEDSDEEVLEKESKANETKTVERTTTEELFSTLEGNEKFTLSDRNNLETGENMTLLWKDTEEQESANAHADDEDLLALCSGRFEATQARPPLSNSESIATIQAMTTPSDFILTESDRMTAESEQPITTAALFTQHGNQQVDDGELIALCSGTFATQRQTSDLEAEQPLPSEVTTNGKLVIASSDEENLQQDEEEKTKKKRKRRKLNISDDEESEMESEADEIGDADDGEVAEDEDEPERFVDYDSEENEVEVVLSKKDKEKVAKTFVENEAELSESEWGSADEDEKDLDRYDIELGDEEKFDQEKLQEELERIHMRRILEQDKKEVKTLQDMFFEDEEKDGVGRERQFRWRNVETTFTLDYDNKGKDEQKAEGEESDGETEAQWRKMRFEREMLLKEKKIDLDSIDLSGSLGDQSVQEDVENNPIADNQSTLVMKRKLTVVRQIKTVEASNKPQESCFLIKQSTSLLGHSKASFLTRDSETLKRLANLAKVNPETEGLNTATAGKGRNFVFTAVSPAVDKMGSKRSSDAAELNESNNSAKKVKTTDESPKAESKKRLLLAQLM